MSSKKKAGKVACAHCGKKVSRKKTQCKKCGQMMPWALAAAHESAGGNVVPITAARGKTACYGCGMVTKARSPHCHGCGAPKASTSAHADWVAKRARTGGDTWLGEQFARERDPERSAGLYAEIVKQAGGVPGMLLKMYGGRAGLEAAWRNESDPGRAEVMWRALHPELFGNGGGAA